MSLPTDVLSVSLTIRIGALMREDVRRAAGTARYDESRAMLLEWLQFLEARLREEARREIDTETLPTWQRRQAE